MFEEVIDKTGPPVDPKAGPGNGGSSLPPSLERILCPPSSSGSSSRDTAWREYVFLRPSGPQAWLTHCRLCINFSILVSRRGNLLVLQVPRTSLVSKFSSLLTLPPTSGLCLPPLPPTPGKLKSRKLKSLHKKAVPIWPPRLFLCPVTGDCSQTAVHTGHFKHKSFKQNHDLKNR